MRVLLVGVAVGLGLAGVVRALRPPTYTLHVYDHCPFCNRVEYLMARHGIEYKRVTYGYGEGAKPEACGGIGYGVGPVALTGKKVLPVLEGPGVPCASGARGMAESLEICAFLIGTHKLVVPCESGRADVQQFVEKLASLKPKLVEDRMVWMPVKDWVQQDDIAYRRWKKKLPLERPTVLPQPESIERLNELLNELPLLLRGPNCLNVWGWGMDDVRAICLAPNTNMLENQLRVMLVIVSLRFDWNVASYIVPLLTPNPQVILLPLLRSFTCVKGAKFPIVVEDYMALGSTQMMDYRPHAV